MKAQSTPIPGLHIFDTPVYSDSRGWFKENWQSSKFAAAGGLAGTFRPVQQNVSFNRVAGITRGFHAEPWHKLISVITGSIFGAWVDLRRGPTFGQSFSLCLSVDRTVMAPRGVASAFQTLQDYTVCSYLVSDYWREGENYVMLNLADPSVAIKWPIPLGLATMSEQDREHPLLSAIAPMSDCGP